MFSFRYLCCKDSDRLCNSTIRRILLCWVIIVVLCYCLLILLKYICVYHNPIVNYFVYAYLCFQDLSVSKYPVIYEGRTRMWICSMEYIIKHWRSNLIYHLSLMLLYLLMESKDKYFHHVFLSIKYFRTFKQWRVLFGFHDARVQFICIITDKQSPCKVLSFWYRKQH